jgi:hypothetical protein
MHFRAIMIKTSYTEDTMNTQWIRAGAIGSFIAAGLLLLQAVIGMGLGSDFILLETSFDTTRIAQFLQTHATPMTQMMVSDDLFVVAYTVAFVGLAMYLLPQNRLLAIVALGFALITTATDFTENSFTVVMTRVAASGGTLQAEWIMLLQILSQLKYLWIFVGVSLFAIGIWNKTLLHRVVAMLFWLFPILGVFAILSVSAALLRVFWMLVLLIAGGIFLWRESLEQKT